MRPRTPPLTHTGRPWAHAHGSARRRGPRGTDRRAVVLRRSPRTEAAHPALRYLMRFLVGRSGPNSRRRVAIDERSLAAVGPGRGLTRAGSTRAGAGRLWCGSRGTGLPLAVRSRARRKRCSCGSADANRQRGLGLGRARRRRLGSALGPDRGSGGGGEYHVTARSRRGRAPPLKSFRLIGLCALCLGLRDRHGKARSPALQSGPR